MRGNFSLDDYVQGMTNRIGKLMKKCLAWSLATLLSVGFVLPVQAEQTASTQRKFKTWTVEQKTTPKTTVVPKSMPMQQSTVKQTTPKASTAPTASAPKASATPTASAPKASTAPAASANSDWRQNLAASAKKKQADAKAEAERQKAAEKQAARHRAALEKAAKEQAKKEKAAKKKKQPTQTPSTQNTKQKWENYSKTGIKNINGEAIVREAARYKSVRYVFGGTTPKGFDCSGYVQYVFKKFNATLPRTADVQVRQGVFVTQRQLKPGDLVFFSTYEPGASHVGIYAGNGKFWSATSSRGIWLCGLADDYWRARYYGARRVLVSNGEPK